MPKGHKGRADCADKVEYGLKLLDLLQYQGVSISSVTQGIDSRQKSVEAGELADKLSRANGGDLLGLQAGWVT